LEADSLFNFYGLPRKKVSVRLFSIARTHAHNNFTSTSWGRGQINVYAWTGRWEKREAVQQGKNPNQETRKGKLKTAEEKKVTILRFVWGLKLV